MQAQESAKRMGRALIHVLLLCFLPKRFYKRRNNCSAPLCFVARAVPNGSLFTTALRDGKKTLSTPQAEQAAQVMDIERVSRSKTWG